MTFHTGLSLEELLEQARDVGGNYRRKLNEAAQENAELRKALIGVHLANQNKQ